MVNKKVLHVLLFIMLIGMLFFFQLGAYTAEAKSVQEPVVSNNLDWSPFLWAVIIIGGSIGITLSYVSWRKYKGEQKYRKKKDKMID
ncbi:sporulation protein YpjB [Oceanobacillus salinisoli]|uniref:sporulation protein YpjB n=1 Tax=Oceanobacillus salinisoli TaxID=2678611 RepID=UPI001E553305|nr:sporulation protein YpjB [Oceanobacillus salinisoli]